MTSTRNSFDPNSHMSTPVEFEPINGQHSIKEVSITLFLAAPIVKPSRFTELFKTVLREKFHKAEVLNTVEVKLKSNISSNDHKAGTKVNNDAGFKFTRFDESGQPEIIFQGVNEDNRSFFSFHTLSYTRWNAFLKEFQDVIDLIRGELANIYVIAFGLHYIDQFIWNSEDQIDYTLLFKTDSLIIPPKLFESPIAELLLRYMSNSGELPHATRIQIETEPEEKAVISISHNIIHKLDDISELNSSQGEDVLIRLLNIAHRFNKEDLSSMLTDDVLLKIGLKK